MENKRTIQNESVMGVWLFVPPIWGIKRTLIHGKGTACSVKNKKSWLVGFKDMPQWWFLHHSRINPIIVCLLQQIPFSTLTNFSSLNCASTNFLFDVLCGGDTWNHILYLRTRIGPSRKWVQIPQLQSLKFEFYKCVKNSIERGVPHEPTNRNKYVASKVFKRR